MIHKIQHKITPQNNSIVYWTLTALVAYKVTEL